MWPYPWKLECVCLCVQVVWFVFIIVYNLFLKGPPLFIYSVPESGMHHMQMSIASDWSKATSAGVLCSPVLKRTFGKVLYTALSVTSKSHEHVLNINAVIGYQFIVAWFFILKALSLGENFVTFHVRETIVLVLFYLSCQNLINEH